jgi:hypothetical protein
MKRRDITELEKDIDRQLQDFYRLPTIGKADDIFTLLEVYADTFHFYKRLNMWEE